MKLISKSLREVYLKEGKSGLYHVAVNIGNLGHSICTHENVSYEYATKAAKAFNSHPQRPRYWTAYVVPKEDTHKWEWKRGEGPSDYDGYDDHIEEEVNWNLLNEIFNTMNIKR